MKPQYLFFALFGLLAVAGYFLTWGEWKGPLPPGMGPAEGWRRATVPASYAIDLETGAVKESEESARDLWWEAKTQTEFCLCPYRFNNRNVVFAPVPAAEVDALGADRAATLQYSDNGFPMQSQARESAPGLGFAVRTSEGNFAKVRVVKFGADRSLTLDWRMLGPVTVKSAPTRNPSLESRRLLEEVRANLRGGKDPERAAALLDEVLPLVNQYQEGGRERIEALNEVGQLYWSARRTDTALAVVTQAEAEISRHQAEAGARPLPWRAVYETYWWLGVLNRDQARFAEAIPWLEQAAVLARGASVADHNEEGLRIMSLTSSLSELAQITCRLGQKDAARQYKHDLQEACAASRYSGSIGACRTEQLRC